MREGEGVRRKEREEEGESYFLWEGCGSRPGQRRLILVSVWRPAELAPGTVEIHW